MWKKFQKIPPRELQDMSFQIRKKKNFDPVENRVAVVHKLTKIVLKKFENGGPSLNLFFEANWLHA